LSAALGFDFTNGFHDTANAMATSIATGALRPKVAVLLSAVLNLVGAFLSIEVALTVTNAVVKIQDSDGAPRSDLLADGGTGLLIIVLAGVIGGILWNLLTWLLGLPSSSSHALFGGIIGATVAGVGTWLIYRITVGVAARFTDNGFRWGQIGSASLVSLAHGTNDAQKTMGVITLALIAAGEWSNTEDIPLWVRVSCALAIALGTYLGGWRIIRTLGKGLVEIAPPQGFAAESAAATVILTSSHLGFALSTTHVATGSILGSGVGRPGAKVRWAVAGRMVTAWLITLPAAALAGALMWFVADLIGGVAGAFTVFALMLAAAGFMWLHSRRTPIDHSNVNDEWEGATREPARAGS
jgi:PiT family inorganic phosphate transporter